MMTPTEPIRLTPQMVERMYQEHSPEKVARFKEVHATLQNPAIPLETRKKRLQELLERQIEAEELKGGVFYCWEGARGTYQLEIPVPLELNNQNGSIPLAAQEAQQANNIPKRPSEAEAAQPSPIPQALAGRETIVPEASRGPSGSETGIGKPETGLFTALAELLGDSTLLMSISKTAEEGEPVLMVNAVPKAEGDAMPFTPISLEGTVSELDRHFLTAIRSKTESRKHLEQAIAEEKEADRALAEAKKQEADVKKKQAEVKKRATEKGAEQLKAEERKADAARQQEPLF